LKVIVAVATLFAAKIAIDRHGMNVWEDPGELISEAGRVRMRCAVEGQIEHFDRGHSTELFGIWGKGKLETDIEACLKGRYLPFRLVHLSYYCSESSSQTKEAK